MRSPSFVINGFFPRNIFGFVVFDAVCYNFTRPVIVLLCCSLDFFQVHTLQKAGMGKSGWKRLEEFTTLSEGKIRSGVLFSAKKNPAVEGWNGKIRLEIAKRIYPHL